MGGEARAQSFFAEFVADPVTGVDRGSTTQIRRVDEPQRFVTLSSIGSEPIGPYIASFGLSLPFALPVASQLDLVAVVGGPAEEGGRELLAGGIGYRFDLGAETTVYINYDAGGYLLGTEDLLPLDVRGSNDTLSLGLRRVWSTGLNARLTGSLELTARGSRAEVLGQPGTDENLRLLRFALLHETGQLFGARRRLSVSLTKGLAGLGASRADNPRASAPGVTSEFLRLAASAEASVPLRGKNFLNFGVIGQYSVDSLPPSQRCGYGTNNYARGFDQSFVNGDRCLGARIEVAHDFRGPALQSGKLQRTQGFVGLDGGWLRDNSNALLRAETDQWASLSWGLRHLQGDFLGELSITHILDEPLGAADQDTNRLWFQAAYQF
ncbi:ShlB/FhaC/HecB family hemolysin secretion/activation protein [Salipiger sp. CCB-MM3]|uniref:ShlB/FhaC/HecB family hemolysin secretion/activation protein n=1 Tax=Salipiger sp. CCB-MM3 TaxID=1792508 RepID=UPI0012FA19C0|nr:ShlB/FhaC/HecB family hemolysin secretion/activation protein [Salipiger sp. CCB-MM3]